MEKWGDSRIPAAVNKRFHGKAESSVTLIFRFANMTSILIMIAMLVSLYG